LKRPEKIVGVRPFAGVASVGLDASWPTPFGCECGNPQIAEIGQSIKTIF